MQLFLMAICSKLCLHFHLKIGSGSLVQKSEPTEGDEGGDGREVVQDQPGGW